MIPHKPEYFEMETTAFDKFTEISSWILLGALWIFCIYCFTIFPEKIPIHFNLAGQPDGFGQRGVVFAFPVLATIPFILMSAAIHSPSDFIYTTARYTEEQMKQQRESGARTLRYLRPAVILLFLLSLGHIYAYVFGKNHKVFFGLIIALILLSSASLILIALYSLVKSKFGKS